MHEIIPHVRVAGGPVLPRTALGYRAATHRLTGLGGAAVLLAHELSHAVVDRRARVEDAP